MTESNHSSSTEELQIHRSVGRRNFMASTGLIVGSLALSTQSSDAFFLSGSRAQFDTSSLPKDWVRFQSGEIQAYARYLSKIKLEKITIQDVIKAHARKKGSVWNEIPPRSLWKNMAASLKAADRVALTMGTSLKEITSAYRSPAYNARCPGAKPRSYHQQNVALDLMFSASPSRVSRVARELRNNGLFKGGVGRYRNFTHIDTRGYNADW